MTNFKIEKLYDLKNFDKIIGKWKLSGDAHGQVEYKWAEGHHFIIQDIDIEYDGKKIKGVEIIGYIKNIGKKLSEQIHSRFYSYLNGLTLDYIYELSGNTLVIWFGEKNSDNFYRGTFSKDGSSFKGAWQWPGGGYSVTGTRIK